VDREPICNPNERKRLQCSSINPDAFTDASKHRSPQLRGGLPHGEATPYSRRMDQSLQRVRLAGLDKLDARRMGTELTDEVAFEEEVFTAEKAGEPMTVIAVVTLSALGLKVLGQWLMKQRQRGVLEYTIEIERSNGDREKHVVRLGTTSSMPGSADVVRAVGEALNLDTELVSSATSKPDSE
jgi:hypothetical protein